MKRSEVIKLIEGLFDIAGKFPNNINAENLLSHLEQIGMKPPLYRYEDGDLGSYIKYQWEPENE